MILPESLEELLHCLAGVDHVLDDKDILPFQVDELLRADADDLDLTGRLGVLVALQPHELDPHRHALLVVAVQVVDLVLQSGLLIMVKPKALSSK